MEFDDASPRIVGCASKSTGCERHPVEKRLMPILGVKIGRGMTTTKDTENTKGKAVDSECGAVGNRVYGLMVRVAMVCLSLVLAKLTVLRVRRSFGWPKFSWIVT